MRAKLTNTDDSKRLQNEIKAAKTMSLVVGSYVICWIPATIFFLFVIAREELLKLEVRTNYNYAYYIQLAVTTYLNTLVDPLIYAARVQEVREVLKYISLFLFRFKKSNTNENSTTIRTE